MSQSNDFGAIMQITQELRFGIIPSRALVAPVTTIIRITVEGRDFRVEQIPLIGYYIAVYDHDEFDGYFIEVD